MQGWKEGVDEGSVLIQTLTWQCLYALHSKLTEVVDKISFLGYKAEGPGFLLANRPFSLSSDHSHILAMWTSRQVLLQHGLFEEKERKRVTIPRRHSIIRNIRMYILHHFGQVLLIRSSSQIPLTLKGRALYKNMRTKNSRLWEPP